MVLQTRIFFQVGEKWFCKLRFFSGSRKVVDQKKKNRVWRTTCRLNGWVIVCLSKNVFISFNQIAFSNLNLRWKDPFFALPIINFRWRKPGWIINSVDVTSKQHLQWMNGLVFRIFLSVLVLFLGSILWVFCNFIHHTIILSDWTFKKWTLSSFAFQSF